MLIGGALAVIAGGLWLAVHHVAPDDFLAWATATKQHATGHAVPALALFGAAVFAAAACAVPIGAFLTATGGFLFGAVTAGAMATSCGTLGAIVLFATVRRLAVARVRDAAPSRMGQIMAEFRSGAASYLLFLRLAPAPFFMVTIWAGAARVRLSTFAWVTAVGMMPMAFAHAFAGAAIGSSATMQRQAYEACVAARAANCTLPSPMSVLADPTTILTLTVAGVLALVPVTLRKLLRGTPLAVAPERSEIG